MDGDVKAIKLICDRHDGRIPLHAELEHDGVMTIRVEYADQHSHAADAASGGVGLAGDQLGLGDRLDPRG